MLNEEKLKQLQEKRKLKTIAESDRFIKKKAERQELFDKKVARIKAVAERVNMAIGMTDYLH